MEIMILTSLQVALSTSGPVQLLSAADLGGGRFHLRPGECDDSDFDPTL